MKLLVLHLSDMHVRSAHDALLSRAGRLVEAIRDLDHEVGLCVLALTGDVAFSGQREEYAAAGRFVAEIKTKLEQSIDGLRVECVAIPGNHDCNFSTQSAARTNLIEGMLKEIEVARDPIATSTCLAPQANFFAFREASGGSAEPNGASVYYEYRFQLEGKSVLFRCLNTAWVSEKREGVGKLTYLDEFVPLAPVGVSRPTDSVVLTLMHHTYNWLLPSNIRALRRRIQTVSDFVFTGHEHEFGISQQVDQHGGSSVYVEGLALQGAGGEESGFNAVYIDLDEEKYRVVSCIWQQDRYQQDEAATNREWMLFKSNPLRVGHAFPISGEWRDFLSDPGVTLLHPARGSLVLDDVFVYPDLREYKAEPTSGLAAKVLRSEELFEEETISPRILITGDDEAGKTTLAKRLYLDALDQGLVPIFINAAVDRLRGDGKDRKELSRLFEHQYSASGEEYFQVEKGKRLVIVDNASSLGTSRQAASRVVEYLAHIAGRVVLIADKVAQLVQDVAGMAPLASGREVFKHYGILPMGHVRREELIEKYVNLAGLSEPESAEILRDDCRRILTAAVGKYFATPTPIAVVSILQARAFNEQLNIQQATQGYYYELLIKRQLLGGSQSLQDMDLRLSYLTELSYAAYEAGVSVWEEEWFIGFHSSFNEQRMLKLLFRDVVKLLTERGILSYHDQRYSFKYPYVSHYFVARALAGRIASDEGKEQIGRLTRRLHEQDASNILLFLAHLSTDKAIIEPMLAQANSLFSDSLKADLRVTEGSLPELEDALKTAVFEDRPSRELRARLLQGMDDLERGEGVVGFEGVAIGESGRAEHSETERLSEEAEREEREQAVNEVVAAISRIQVALRTMQILGQIVKGFPGHLHGDQKEKIVRAVYGVALRTLGYLHEVCRQQTEALAAQVVGALRREHPNLSNEQLLDHGRGVVYWHMYMAALGLTQRTAIDVGHELLDPVFDAIESSDGAPSIKLLSIAIKLNRPGRFPENATLKLHDEFEKNVMAHRVLRGLVVAHFHLYDLPHTVKQSLCKQLGVVYKPSLPRSRTRLVGRTKEDKVQ